VIPAIDLSDLKNHCLSLETEIRHTTSTQLYDQLAVQRLKRQALRMREKIQKIENALTPDIVA
jgi:hypothetical protein